MLHIHDAKTAACIEVDATVRYWEDASVNGVEDVDGTLVHGREGDDWKVLIDLDEGRIRGWPADMAARIHYKVCDEGLYWLQDSEGRRIARWRGSYVPDEFLCHGDEGFGDYIILNVEPGGAIAGFRRPAIDPARWEALPVGG